MSAPQSNPEHTVWMKQTMNVFSIQEMIASPTQPLLHLSKPALPCIPPKAHPIQIKMDMGLALLFQLLKLRNNRQEL